MAVKIISIGCSTLLVGIQTASAASIGEPFRVPNDTAVYTVLDVSKPKGSVIIATSQRDGSSGTSFAIREIDCKRGTFRYLANADTLAEAKAATKSKDRMGPLVSGSISSYIAGATCSIAGLK